MSDHFIGDSFNFKFIEEIFIQMGLSFGAKKLQTIDNKSKRILNRLGEYVKDKAKASLLELFKDEV